MRIAIIGTAGRGGEALLTRETYFKMYKHVLGTIRSICPEVEDVQLQSGGAAWGDALSVSLYLNKKSNSLILHLPCAWDGKQYIKHQDATNSWAKKTADTANYYHRKFSAVIKHDSLKDIQSAYELGATLVQHSGGFFVRNLEVGKCDVLLAYTFGSSSVPADGGTLHTWNQSSAPIKHHFPIQDLE
jgi:hypothetical protein